MPHAPKAANGSTWPRLRAAVLALAGAGLAAAWLTPARAGDVQFADAAGTYSVPITTLKERQLRRIIRQQYDFSCGSAALATLLTHHYGRPATEVEIFTEMWERGDQARIQKSGFSLLDMKNYLQRRGLKASAFRAPLDKLASVRVPAVTVIKNGNITHFVVIKGIEKDRVVVADPYVGTRVMDRADFEKAWNGVIFVLLDDVERGQASFNRAEDWSVRPRAPLQAMQGGSSLGGMLLQLPSRSFF